MNDKTTTPTPSPSRSEWEGGVFLRSSSAPSRRKERQGNEDVGQEKRGGEQRNNNNISDNNALSHYKGMKEGWGVHLFEKTHSTTLMDLLLHLSSRRPSCSYCNALPQMDGVHSSKGEENLEERDFSFLLAPFHGALLKGRSPSCGVGDARLYCHTFPGVGARRAEQEVGKKETEEAGGQRRSAVVPAASSFATASSSSSSLYQPVNGFFTSLLIRHAKALDEGMMLSRSRHLYDEKKKRHLPSGLGSPSSMPFFPCHTPPPHDGNHHIHTSTTTTTTSTTSTSDGIGIGGEWAEKKDPLPALPILSDRYLRYFVSAEEDRQWSTCGKEKDPPVAGSKGEEEECFHSLLSFFIHVARRYTVMKARASVLHHAPAQ